MTKVQLAPLEWEHWKAYRACVNDGEIAHLIDRYLPVTKWQHQEFYRALLRDKSRIFFSIVNMPKQRFVGVCALKNLDSKNRKAELYICLTAKNARGKGWGRQAVQELLKYAFNTLNLNRVYLYTPEYNHAAIHCYKSVGFIEEGRFQEDIFAKGKYYDSVRMAYFRRFHNQANR